MLFELGCSRSPVANSSDTSRMTFPTVGEFGTVSKRFIDEHDASRTRSVVCAADANKIIDA